MTLARRVVAGGDHVNSAIELHDSTVGQIREVDGSILVTFTPAYFHKSKGWPGIDPGTGWAQEARLTLSGAVIRGPLPDMPAGLWDGGLRIGGDCVSNVIPLPLQALGGIELSLVFRSGHEVIIAAGSIVLELVGEARYIEEWPWPG